MPIAAIRRDLGTQIRSGLDEATVSAYAEALKGGAQFPPVTVFYDGHQHVLADGFHTTEATLRNGETRIAAAVHKGGVRDALLYACGANAMHGLQRTNADKRRAVETLLADPEWAKWSTRKLAAAAGVSHEFVRQVSTVDSRPGAKARNDSNGTARQTPIEARAEGDHKGQPVASERVSAGGDEGAGGIRTFPDGVAGPPAPDEPIPYRLTAPPLEMDLLGLELTEMVRANWSRLEAALVAFDGHLHQAQAALTEYISQYSTGELEPLRKETHDLAARARKAYRPKSVCLYCKDPNNEHLRRANCNGCRERGWLSEEQLGAVPRELREHGVVIDQKRGGFVVLDGISERKRLLISAAVRDVKEGGAKRLHIQDGEGRELVVERDEDDAEGWT
jgi:hypothetical protein